jgi:hypothetical protein
VKTVVIPLGSHSKLPLALLSLRRGFCPLRENLADGGGVGFVERLAVFEDVVV